MKTFYGGNDEWQEKSSPLTQPLRGEYPAWCAECPHCHKLIVGIPFRREPWFTSCKHCWKPIRIEVLPGPAGVTADEPCAGAVYTTPLGVMFLRNTTTEGVPIDGGPYWEAFIWGNDNLDDAFQFKHVIVSQPFLTGAAGIQRIA